MSKLRPDFGGYATKNDIKCSDGRVILPNAFEEMDGQTVPLVWRHLRDNPSNVLGHGLLENRDDGVYVYGFFNETEDGQRAKSLVEHKDIDALSIFANNLIEKSKKVAHGVIREVSLVLSGANPGAKIDFVAVQHEEGGMLIESEDEAIIHTGEFLELPSKLDETEEEEFLEETEVVIHEDETIGEVFNTLNDAQKKAVYAIIGGMIEEGAIKQSAISEDEEENEEVEEETLEHNEGDSHIMKENVFDKNGKVVGQLSNQPYLSQEDFDEIQTLGREVGSLRKAFLAHEGGAQFLQHAGTYGIGSDRANLELLFPEARNVTREPTWISRPMEWVSGVLTSTKKVPFSRIKSMHANITADEARARGYITGNQKVEEVFPVLRRITTPHTIYKKQKLDRDDIVDITDFDVVRWLKGEMQVMLKEEIARCVLIGDGRDPVTEVDDHVPTDNVRPVYQDDVVYVHNVQVALARTADEMIDDLIAARDEYRGSGNPTLYCEPSQLTAWLLLRDLDGRRLYRTKAELAAELDVKEIVTVPVMSGVENDAATHDLRAIIVNLRDYTVGADKGGEMSFFDDFDIDYNQMKYLYEVRLSGALTVPKGAITLEQAKT